MPFVGTAAPRTAGPRPRFFSNYLRTGALMAALIALLALGGRAIAGAPGMALFAGFGLVMNFVMYWFSDRIALMAHRAQPVTRAEAPSIYAIVERLTSRAGMPMPRIYIIPSAAANAFATGRNPSHAAVAVTDGILQILSERQLEAVLAHELSHVKNRDVLIATIAAAVAGLVSTIGHVMQWGFMFAGSRSDDDDRGGGLAALAWIIVAPIIAVLIQLAISRSRELGADASGASLCGHPEDLASALAAAGGRPGSPTLRVRRSRDGAPLHRQPAAGCRRGVHEPVVDAPADRRTNPAPRSDAGLRWLPPRSQDERWSCRRSSRRSRRCGVSSGAWPACGWRLSASGRSTQRRAPRAPSWNIARSGCCSSAPPASIPAVQRVTVLRPKACRLAVPPSPAKSFVYRQPRCAGTAICPSRR